MSDKPTEVKKGAEAHFSRAKVNDLGKPESHAEKLKDANDGKQEQKKVGKIDESERSFDAKREKPIAEYLAKEGHDVKSLKEVSNQGRQADALVDGKKTEFKKLEPGATNSTVKGCINDSVRRGGQARDMVIDARGSGLSKSEANRGLDRAQGITRGRLDSARVLGDDYNEPRNFK